MAPTSAPLSTPPSKEMPTEAVDRAVKALLQWKAAKSKDQKLQLLAPDEFLYLVVTLKKIPEGRTNPYKIPLTHPLYSASGDNSSEFCLFIDDRPGRKPTSKDAKEKIAAENIPISKVIKFTKLKSDYKPFEAKRKLSDSYDLFLTDRRIVPLLPKCLGKHFFKKKRIPVAVDLSHNNWKEQVERICSSALLFLKTGTCSVVRVARGSMEKEEIVENVIAAISGVTETVPRKWKNIRSLHLKFSESLALPIYQSVPDMNLTVSGLVKNEGLVEKKKRVREEKGDEPSSVKKQKKDVAKKGRIDQVRYMDAGADEAASDEEEKDVVDEEMSGDDDNETEEAVKPVKKKKVAKDLKLKKSSAVKASKKKAEAVGKTEIGKEKVSKKKAGAVSKTEIGKEKVSKKKAGAVSKTEIGKENGSKKKAEAVSKTEIVEEKVSKKKAGAVSKTEIVKEKVSKKKAGAASKTEIGKEKGSEVLKKTSAAKKVTTRKLRS